jgi:hypothetical protein
MDKIKIRVKRSSESGIFHDSRKDIRVLGEMVNLLIDRVNELIEENNKLKNKASN